MSLFVKDFDYNLPKDLIAQKPVNPRDHSRLLLLNKSTGEIHHKYFYDIIDYLKPGDLLVLNNSKVFPARLHGYKKDTGGLVEIFLHQKLRANSWECLLRGKIKEGLVIHLDKELEAKVVKNNNNGTWEVDFSLSGLKFWRVINQIGEVPLPPYIKRTNQLAGDKTNYQTVFASGKKVGSVAAPTAGLHFTKALISKIRKKNIKIVEITLHVGLGTFAPLKVDNIIDHKIHREFIEVSQQAIEKILKTKEKGGRIIPLGTTSCRALESIDWGKLDLKHGATKQSFWTDIFIYPGYQFQVTDALITNFHLPKSSLLMLVSALAGSDHIKTAYRLAVKEKYRFFSYGDAMFIY